MLHSLLFASFDDPARQAWYEAVHDTLQAEANAPPTVLLGNLVLGAEEEEIDALILRPHNITVLLYAPGGGQLEIPATAGAWQLQGAPLPWTGTAPNPFAQFQRQQLAVAYWLSDSLSPEPVRAEQVSGIVLFAATVSFDAGVERYLRTLPGNTGHFQLLSQLPHLPRRLQQLAHPAVALTEADFTSWWQDLADNSASGETPEVDGTGQGYWEQRARQLWRWLGADDIPHDAPYGGTTVVAASQEEKQRLEQLRQQVREELLQQRQEMEAREAERERSIAQLRDQLTQAPPATAEVTDLQARLAAETREKQLLEQAFQASRQESAARNQELDARIQQLGQLIQQMQSQPPTPTPPPAPALPPAPSRAPVVAAAPAPRPAPSRPAPPAASPHKAPNLLPRQSAWQLRWPRVALLVAAAGGLAMGAWGLVHLSNKLKDPEPSPQSNTRTRESVDQEEAEATAPSLSDIQPDTLTLDTDEGGASRDEDTIQESAPEVIPEQAPPTPQEGEVMDSTTTLPDDI